MQADTYLLLCQKYIELNPVRANMAEDPAHYRWSRYRANGLRGSDMKPAPVAGRENRKSHSLVNKGSRCR